MWVIGYGMNEGIDIVTMHGKSDLENSKSEQKNDITE